MISFCFYASLCMLIINSINGSALFETARLRSRFIRQVDDGGGDVRIDQCVEESAPQIIEEIPDSKVSESLRIRVAARRTPEPEPTTTAPSSTPGTVKILGPEVGFFRSVTHHLHEIAEKEHTAAKERQAEKSAPKGAKKKDPKVGTAKSVEKVTFKPTLFIKTKNPEPKLKSKEPKTPLRINIKRNKDRIETTNKILSIKQSRVPDSLASSCRLGKTLLPNRRSNDIQRPIAESIGPPPLLARPPPGFINDYNGNKKSQFRSPKLNELQELESGDLQDSMVSATHHNEKVIKVPPNFVGKSPNNYAQEKLSGEENVINEMEPTYEPESQGTKDKQDSNNLSACSDLNPVGIVSQNSEDVDDIVPKRNSTNVGKHQNNDSEMNNDEALKKVLEDNTPVLEDSVKPILRQTIGLDSSYSPYDKGVGEERATVEASNPIESDNISSESKNDNTYLLNSKTDGRNSLTEMIKDYSGSKNGAFGEKPVTLDDIREVIKLKKPDYGPKLQAVEKKPEALLEDNIQLASIEPCKVPHIKLIEPIKAINSHNILSESIHEYTDSSNANIAASNALMKITKDSRLRNIQTEKKTVSLADIRKLIHLKRLDHKQKLLATKKEPSILPIDELKLFSQDAPCDKPEVTESIERSVSDIIPLESMNNAANLLQANNVDAVTEKTSSEITKDHGQLSERTLTKTPPSSNLLRKILKFKHLYVEPNLQATEREPVSKPKDNTTFESPCELSEVGATESTENIVSDNILSESMKYETNLPNNMIDFSGKNVSPKTREGLPKSKIGKKIIFPPEIRKIIRSKKLKIVSQSTTLAPDFIARDNIKQKSQNAGEALKSSLSDDRPSQSENDDIISSNPNISAAEAKISSKATKDKLLKIPLVKKSLSSANIKNRTERKNLALISKANLQIKSSESDTNETSTEKVSTEKENPNQNKDDISKLGDSPNAALDADVAASNVEARSETHIPLVRKAKGSRQNVLPCIKRIREFMQLKKNRLKLQAPNPISSINSEDNPRLKSIADDIFVADNIQEASAIDLKTVMDSKQADDSEQEVVSSILEPPHGVDGTRSIMQDTEFPKELGNNLRKHIIKIKPSSSVPKTLGVVKMESKEITECIDGKAGNPEDLISTPLANAHDESFEEKGKNNLSTRPKNSYSSEKLGSSPAKHLENKMKDFYKFKYTNQKNILKSEKINDTNGDKSSLSAQDRGEAPELDSASKYIRLQSCTSNEKGECIIEGTLEIQKNKLEDINATEKYESDPVSAASDNIPITKEVEPSKSILVRDLLKAKLLRLAQKQMDTPVSTYPQIGDGDFCKKAPISPFNDEESRPVLEPEDLLESVTLNSASTSHTNFKKRPSKLGKSKPSILRAQEEGNCNIDNRSSNKLKGALENCPFNSVPTKQRDPVLEVAPNFEAALESGRKKTLLYKSKPLPKTDVLLEKKEKGEDFDGKLFSKLNHKVTSEVTDEKSPTETSFPEPSVADYKEVDAELKAPADLMPVGSSNEQKILTPQALNNKSDFTRDAKKYTIKDFLESKKEKKDSLRLSKDTDKSGIEIRELKPKSDNPLRNEDVSVLRESYARLSNDRCISPEVGSDLNKNALARIKSGDFILECRLTPKLSKDF